ncbi:MAG: flagellar hook-length control protein FliK [bacterium]|nr:flagellar hook-length control protein FliK [bacterium]
MNVQAIISEPAELPASGASQSDEQTADGAAFEELLAEATTQEDQFQGDAGETGAEEGEGQILASLAAEVGATQLAQDNRILPMTQGLNPNIPLPVDEGVQNSSAQLPLPALQDAEVEQPGRSAALIENLGEGLRENLQENLSGEKSEAASAAPIRPLPEAAVAPAVAELPTPAVIEAAVAELPVAQPPATESSARALPEAAQVAPDLQVGATGGGMTTGSDGGAQDAALRGQAPDVESETLPPTARGSEFAAALEARDEARPAPAPPVSSQSSAVPVAPVETTQASTAPATTSTAAPLPGAGAPEEVLPVHVEWLAARQGGNARISLHPPELGELELMVKVRGSAVDIVIRAQEPAAQMAAAQSRDLLVDALSMRELRIDQFDVRGLQSDLANDDSPAQTNPQAQQDASAKAGGEKREGSDERSGSQELASEDGSEPGSTLTMPPPVVDLHTAIDLLA